MTTPGSEQDPQQPPSYPGTPAPPPPSSYPQQGYPPPPPGYPPPPPGYGQQAYPPQQQLPPGFPVPYGYPVHNHPAYAPVPRQPVSGATRAIGWALFALGVLTAIAACLPWVTFLGYSVSGLGNDETGAKDGVLTLPLGVVVAGLGLARGLVSVRSAYHLVAATISLVIGGLIALIGIVDVADVGDTGYGVSVGFGLVLTLIAGIALIGTAIAGIAKRT